MNENEYTFLMKIVKSLVYTIIIVIGSLLVFYLLMSLIGNNMSAEQSDIIYMFITIIFTIFFCTFTILDELKKNSNHYE